ncbi:late expression factor 1 [Epinotia aporema granulovirus]|uniref:Late expression factor 1 n=1 Tax=Epinotia aporema granulovirus TaxID=166056 RepID=K4ER63_9BBAC|nr:late expression factor 1 [Epinotia aporema granulovirus]AER41494.1 late expression factor 1 [Epinotia aporema granulovirus]
MVYSREQVVKIWNSVAFRDDRYWAFMLKNGRWHHSDSEHSSKKTFGTLDEFYSHINNIGAQDVHVKSVIDGGREWVIDVDHHDTDPDKIALKNMIAHATFGAFFKDNCDRIMFSGNRGLHVWLNRTEFDYTAAKETRTYYYDCILQKPNSINRNCVAKNSLHDCFLNVFDNQWIQRNIAKLYPNIKLDNNNQLLQEFFPSVDKQVFVTTKQIRAPYSYHSKSKKFNCDHEFCA